MTSVAHVPVLLEETLAVLAPGAGATLLDGTLGLGGHASGWLARTRDAGAVGRVVGIDRDRYALDAARARLDEAFPGRADLLHHGSYEDAAAAVAAAGLSAVDGALLDLGASSLQLDTAARGFSFQAPGPLDMRMDAAAKLSAADVVNTRDEDALADVFSRFGEEPRARTVARAIVNERRRAPFRDTLRLAECVAQAVGGRRGRLHPATRVFQALRIVVNDELGRLERGLPAVLGCVREGGRMAVLTFHRLEDRLVKRFFQRGRAAGRVRVLPDATPGKPELSANPRSRSARLRAAEVLAA